MEFFLAVTKKDIITEKRTNTKEGKFLTELDPKEKKKRKNVKENIKYKKKKEILRSQRRKTLKKISVTQSLAKKPATQFVVRLILTKETSIPKANFLISLTIVINFHGGRL